MSNVRVYKINLELELKTFPSSWKLKLSGICLYFPMQPVALWWTLVSPYLLLISYQKENKERSLHCRSINWKERGQKWKWTSPPLFNSLHSPPPQTGVCRKDAAHFLHYWIDTHISCNANQPALMSASSTLLFFLFHKIVRSQFATSVLLSPPPDLPIWGFPENYPSFRTECASILDTDCSPDLIFHTLNSLFR